MKIAGRVTPLIAPMYVSVRRNGPEPTVRWVSSILSMAGEIYQFSRFLLMTCNALTITFELFHSFECIHGISVGVVSPCHVSN